MLIHGKTEQNMQKCRIFSVDIEEVLICDKILFSHDSKNLQKYKSHARREIVLTGSHLLLSGVLELEF